MPTDTQTVIDAANKVGDLLAQHPAVEKYKLAQKALSDDPDASRLMQDFQKVLQQVSHNERIGMPPTADQQKALQALQAQIASHLKFKSYSMAEFELTDLLRKISTAWQKPLARTSAAGNSGAQESSPASKLVL